MDAEALEVLETTREAQEAYRALIAEKSKGTVWLGGGCASWYLDEHGVPATWPWTIARFYEALSAPDLSAYALA